MADPYAATNPRRATRRRLEESGEEEPAALPVSTGPTADTAVRSLPARDAAMTQADFAKPRTASDRRGDTEQLRRLLARQRAQTQ